MNELNLELQEQQQGVDKVQPTPSFKSIHSAGKEFTFELPGGILHKDNVYRTVRLREMNAGDRRIFADKKITKNPSTVKSELIKRTLISIDGVGTPTISIIDAMLAMDRNALIYALAKESLKGEPLCDEVMCPVCKTKQFLELGHEELEATRKNLTDTARKRIKDNRCVFEVSLPEYNFKATCRYTDGRFESYLAQKMSDQDLDPNYLLSELIVDFNGQGKLESEGYDTLDIEFVQLLENEIRKHTFGYDFNPELKCYSCGHTQNVTTDPLAFLFGKKKM